MDTKKAVKHMLASAGLSSRDLAEAFNTTKAGAATKVSKGIYSVKDLLTVATACGAKITITTKDGTALQLTPKDITAQDAAK